MPNIVRIGDVTTGHSPFPPQPILTGSPTVKANGISVNRIGDSIMPHCAALSCHPSATATGSSTVKANGIPIARIGDMANCGSILATGSPNVIINDAPQPPKSVSVKPSQYDDAAVAQLSLEAGQYAAYDEEDTIGDLPSSQYTDSDGNVRDNPISDEGSLGRESGNSAVSTLKPNQKDSLAFLIKAMNEVGIKDHKEQAMFLAQCDHESAGFTKLREGVYSPDNVWRLRGETLSSFGITLDKLKADAIAKTRQYMYEYMYQDNYRTIKFKTGNDQLGDGIKYIGRGYLQLTGKPNYKKMSKKFGLDLLNHPELVETPEVAAKTSLDYWFTTKCRTPAQRGDVPAVTQIINGGQNGIADRTKKYHDYLTDANLGRFDLPYKEIPASATPTKPVVVDKNGLSSDINTKLSPHFTLGDFSTKCIFPHKVQAQGGFTENDIVYNLKTLANNPVEAIWAKYPNCRINSAFRTYTKGVSQHEKGQACDIQWPNISNAEYLERAKWIRTNVTYDQLLFEHGNSIWIHVSFDPNKSRQRMDCKTMYKAKFTTGLTLYYN